MLPAIRFRDSQDVVIGRFNLAKWKACCEIDRKADRIDQAAIRMLYRWRDPRGIGHPVGIERPAIALRLILDDDRRAWDVPGADDHREAEGESTLIVAYGLLIFDFYRNAILGGDIGDRCRKDIWPFLFNQTGSFAALFRLLIDLFGLGTLLNLSDNRSITHLHPQVIDRSGFRQWEHIDPLRPIVFHAARVDKFLGESRSGNDAGDGNLYVCPQHRCGGIAARLPCLEQETALRDILQSHTRLIDWLLATSEQYRQRACP